jgi:hypothetical protein
MVRKSSSLRFAFALAGVAGAVAAPAITFSNISVQSPPMSTGSSWVIIGNAISFFTPNAIVGDAVDPIRAGILSIQFDATNDQGMVSDELRVNLAAFTAGSGRIDFSERVFELDALGNEIGLIGSVTQTFLPGGGTVWSATIDFTHEVHAIRVKKDFVLTAPIADTVDLAALGIINQSINVIPEPASLAALGMGAVALLARRRKK